MFILLIFALKVINKDFHHNTNYKMLIKSVNIEHMRIYTVRWVDALEQDSNYNHIRFKKLNIQYPRFNIFFDLMDEVELVDFIKSEPNRLPLFIGSPLGISPKPDCLSTGQIFAILSKSLLSGCVAGLAIYRKTDGGMERIHYIHNY